MAEATKHSRFGGSVCTRYMSCPGSVALCGTVPKMPSSRAAAEGSAAHLLAEWSLTKDLHPAHFLGEKITVDGFEFEIDQGMVDAVVVYNNVVLHEQAQTRTGELYIETSFTIDVEGAEPGEVHGKNDAMVYHPEIGRLRIFDYKHGEGVSVDVTDNRQLKFYAIGAIFLHPDWNIKEVVLTIVQPRDRNVDDSESLIRDWKFSLIEVLEFQGELEAAIQKSKNVEPYSAYGLHEGGYLTAGEWCRWCDAGAAGVCPAKKAQAVADAQVAFKGVTVIEDISPPTLPDPATIDLEVLSEFVLRLGWLAAYRDQCLEYLEAQMIRQGIASTKHHKTVPKIGRAKWVDDAEQVAAYAEMMFELSREQTMPPKLATITDMTAALKKAGATKEQIETFKLRFTVKESAGLTIAAITDRREAVNAVAANFGAVALTN